VRRNEESVKTLNSFQGSMLLKAMRRIFRILFATVIVAAALWK
jgi:hypothetical protein